MKTKLLFTIALSFLLFFSCNSEKSNTENCNSENDLGVTELNGGKYILNFRGRMIESDWEVRYSDDLIEIFTSHPYPGGYGIDNYGYVFKKNNDCLEFYYAYDNPYNHYGLPKYVNSIRVANVLIQDWEEDSLISGKIFEITETNEIIERNFWVEFNTSSEYDFSYNTLTSENCLNLVTGYEIDMNSDGIGDITFEKFQYPRNNITLDEESNSIKIVPLNNNFLLTERLLFTEAPFNSVNMGEYIIRPIGNGSLGHNQDHLGLLFEYETPFDRFNTWSSGFGWTHLGNNVAFTNDIDDYLVVKIEKDGEYYYGWIKMNIDFDNCQFEVVETYLNPVANDHVSVP